MLLKMGVDISRLDRSIRKALFHIETTGLNYDTEIVITSTYESNHAPHSLHYANQAVDIRKPDINSIIAFVNDLRSSLGNDYDVIIETDHIHIEYDPKGAK